MEGSLVTGTWGLKDKFRQYKVNNYFYNLQINENGLTVSCEENGIPNHKTQEFKPWDLVGCVCMRAGPKEPRKHMAFFTIYAYPMAISSRKKKRTRISLSFEVDKEDSYEKNLEIASNWRSAIYFAIRNHGGTRTNIDRKKKLLLLINPNSGAGKSNQIYKRQVAPVLGEAEVAHEVIVTKAANHALDLVKTMDLNQYAGLVIVSGDGLLYEVYNGLLSRPDWEKAIEFPVGVIPGGSGNGLARSLAHYVDEPYLANPVLVSALNLAYGYTSPMDLVLVQTSHDQKLSFLSIGLGLISDIDIESERLRSIGESRFAVWAIARLANLRRYHAKISFKRCQTNIVNNNHKIRAILQRSQTLADEPFVECDGVPNQLSRSHSVLPVEDDLNDLNQPLTKVEPNHSRAGSKDEVSTQHGNRKIMNKQVNSDSERATEDNSKYCMPKLHESIPDDWETIEDDFVVMYACYQSHMGTDVFLAPNATLNDGIIWLLIVNGQATKASIAKFLLALDGSHINIPGVEMIPVKAFRVEPSGKSGYLTVDGETIPWGPLQAQVLPSKGQIISR